MEETSPAAAGQSGHTNAPAPLAADEAIRQAAAETLEYMLQTSMDLLTRCQAQANAARGDRLGPVYAAAQLLHANAAIAKALAQVGCVETRHRSIVEQVQTLVPRRAELNSTPRDSLFPEQDEPDDDAHLALERRLDERLACIQRLEEQQEDAAIASCI
jgi:hypothetical protein